MARIGQVLCNDRFLILPSVRVRKLASQGLRRATERVAADWAERDGESPVLGHPLTSPEHSGLRDRAAGWTPCAERTSGRRSGGKRTVWWRALRDDWREILCAEPEHPLGSSPPVWSDEADWAEREYGGSPPTDGRLRRRIVAMGRAWLASLGAPLPVIFPARETRLAADRRLSHRRVNESHILPPPDEATVARCQMESFVLRSKTRPR